eukprot:CAMPEP_0206253754 /NCGR_PEP_ID=MMETSP0047_2-20121206/23323_1 /ASSEMBLY_ACC=CAM_ASM_000192 /TAXON_ID=195065 /ORGANISM="Chroomonas mesostigmatica_cf, Strain CCMP1168" /LENGTH=51 /DNA_ID=CAMNT_0053679989 /DNA_START=281 /DNA_END=432 /DNA_ORIENTATION=-
MRALGVLLTAGFCLSGNLGMCTLSLPMAAALPAVGVSNVSDWSPSSLEDPP